RNPGMKLLNSTPRHLGGEPVPGSGTSARSDPLRNQAMTLSQDAVAPAGELVLEAEALTKHSPVRRGLRDLIGRRHEAVHAVDDVHLVLRRGRVTALVGESGSGKSTVARLLAQLYPRTAGDIRLHGASVRVKGGRRFPRYAARVQMIFQ